MPKKDKFISKKNAVTYRLVPRCQLDPDADSSEHVLVPVDNVKHEKFNINLPACALPLPVKKVPNVKEIIPAKGPHPDLDPDIVAALDGDYEDCESVLDDDFIAQANGPLGEFQLSAEFENGNESDGPLFSDSDDESFPSNKGKRNLKLTSTVTNCTEDIQILNQKFERLCETYEDDQIGALDFDQIEGFLSATEETVKSLEACDVDGKRKLQPYEGGFDEDVKIKTLQYGELYEDGNSDGDDEEEEEVTEEPPVYDAESIISTYSNLYNRPTLIKMEKKEKPEKIWKSGLTKSNLKKIYQEDVESLSDSETVFSSCVRPKDETPEEKKQRKQAVKQLRKESRVLKKQNKLEFKEEKKRRTCAQLNANRCKVIPLGS